MDNNIELTKENLSEWKAVLKSEMFRQYEVADYDETLSDEEWIEDYIGDTPQDAIEAEVECWEE